MRRVAKLLPLAACALALAACGGENTTAPVPETVEGTVTQPTETTPTETSEGPTGDAAAGKRVYASAGCGACHALAAAGSSGTVGPNLDDSMPDVALIVERVTNGRGAMPPFKGQLSDKQIADVAAFVFESTHS